MLPLSSSKCWSLDALPEGERQFVLNMATTLERAEHSGRPLLALRGKNVAVLCENSSCARLQAFRAAAAALGAQVTHIRPSEALISPSYAHDAVGAMLGKLYDAIDCHDLAPEIVKYLERVTGKPVFNELACFAGADSHAPSATGYTLQALLLHALS